MNRKNGVMVSITNSLPLTQSHTSQVLGSADFVPRVITFCLEEF